MIFIQRPSSDFLIRLRGSAKDRERSLFELFFSFCQCVHDIVLDLIPRLRDGGGGCRSLLSRLQSDHLCVECGELQVTLVHKILDFPDSVQREKKIRILDSTTFTH